jgi:nucleotide-binding universal stress UspA family protein
MLSLPQELAPEVQERWQDMLRFLGEHYGTLALGLHFGHIAGVFIGLVVGLLLLSAVNTAVTAMIGLLYMLARDREIPTPFTRLNTHGVPTLPLATAVVLPIILVMLSDDLDSLADMYAIGVVGAITVNLGSCCFNKKLGLTGSERTVTLLTAVLLFAVEVTIAKTKPAALFFAACVLGIGFALRWWAMKHEGFETVILKRELAAAVNPETRAQFKLNLAPGQSILVAARGITPVLRYALEEARLRQATLYVLYVKELAVNLPVASPPDRKPRWQDDRQAAEIMYGMLEMAHEINVTVVPVFIVSDNPAGAILDLAATLGVEIMMLGSPHRQTLVSLLKGNVVTEVAAKLPENIQLIIHS